LDFIISIKNYFFSLGESIAVFLNTKGGEDSQKGLINPIKPEIPTVGHQYVACIYDDLKVIDCLVEIDWSETDELVKTANARRKSVI
jgi:hypothetical protein